MVWYNKYRPQDFNDVIGQELVKSVFQNALSKNKIKHAYLLSGPKGVGKTTLARIFANKLNDVETNPESKIDIVEMDAASNTGIDDVRQLIESASNPPISGKYKVYIIDEVHMLSKSAMNALLKILEEPPFYLVFLLATTNPEKLLPTVLSRLTKLNLTSHTKQGLVSNLKFISEKEGLKIDEKSLDLIASRSGGGQRDAINLLETISGYGLEQYDYETTARLLGILPTDLLEKVLSQLKEGKIETETVERLESAGLDGEQCLAQMVEYVLDKSLQGQTEYDEFAIPLTKLIQERLPFTSVASSLALARIAVKKNFSGVGNQNSDVSSQKESLQTSVKLNSLEETPKIKDFDPLEGVSLDSESNDSANEGLSFQKEEKKENKNVVETAEMLLENSKVAKVEIVKDGQGNTNVGESFAFPQGNVKQDERILNQVQDDNRLVQDDNLQVQDEKISDQAWNDNEDQDQVSNSQINSAIKMLISEGDCPPALKMLSSDLQGQNGESGIIILTISSGVFLGALKSKKVLDWIKEKFKIYLGSEFLLKVEIRSKTGEKTYNPDSVANLDSNYSNSDQTNSSNNSTFSENNFESSNKYVSDANPDMPPAAPIEAFEGGYDQTNSQENNLNNSVSDDYESNSKTDKKGSEDNKNNTDSTPKQGQIFYKIYKKLPENVTEDQIPLYKQEIPLPQKNESENLESENSDENTETSSWDDHADDMFEFE